MPATKKRAVTAPSRAIGAETARQKKLRKLSSRMRRMRILIDKEVVLTSAEDGELTKLGNLTGAGYGEFFEYGSAETLRERILKVEVEKKSDWKVTKTARIQNMRENITASYSAACRWVRGQPEGLTHLETASGEIAVHPQDILMEVGKRGIAQFTKGNDEDKRNEFMRKFGHRCQRQP